MEDVDAAIREAEVIAVRSETSGDVILYGRSRLALSILTNEDTRALCLSFSSPDDLRALRRRVKTLKDIARPASLASSGSAKTSPRLWHYTAGDWLLSPDGTAPILPTGASVSRPSLARHGAVSRRGTEAPGPSTTPVWRRRSGPARARTRRGLGPQPPTREGDER
jgi:hypothetical protein